MKRLFSLILILCLCLPFLGALAEEAPTKIKFFRVAVEQDPTKDRLLLELQKRTNTEIEFVTAPWDGERTRITTILSSGEPIDVMAMDTNAHDYATYCRDGLLLELDEYLTTGKWPILEKLAYGDVYWWRYNVDGKVYGIPMPIQPGDWNNYIRSDWLEKVGLDVPTTPEEMYEVLRAFKEDDPDGNGIDDTIGIYGALTNGHIDPLLQMFVNIRGTYFDVLEDGTIQYNWLTPAYKEALIYINRLYHEGLINGDMFTLSDKNYMRARFSAGQCGWVNSPMIAADYNELLKVDPNAKIVLMSPMPHAPTASGAYAGDANWNWMQNVLPATCSNPEKVLDLLEYLHSAEGRKLICTGIEGIHYDYYEQDDDLEIGVFYGVSAEVQGKDWDPAKGEGPTGSPMWWGMVSTINGIIPFDKYESLEEAMKHTIMFVSKEEYDNNPYWDMRKRGSLLTTHNPVPVVIPEMIAIGSDLESIRLEYQAIIIQAAEDQIDAAWDEYVMYMNSVGLPDAMVAVQAWYDANK